jgi:hypothetical protein
MDLIPLAQWLLIHGPYRADFRILEQGFHQMAPDESTTTSDNNSSSSHLRNLHNTIRSVSVSDERKSLNELCASVTVMKCRQNR